MSGPVWRFEAERQTTCCYCFNPTTGVFVEGEVCDGELQPLRAVCPSCYQQFKDFLLVGEQGQRPPGPAYAHR